MARSFQKPKNKPNKPAVLAPVQPMQVNEVSRNAFSLAYNLHNAGRLQESKVVYELLLSLYPLDFDVIHLLGTNLYQLGDLDSSLPLLEKAVEIAPDVAEAWSNYGNVLKLKGQYEKALVAYKKSVKLKPDGYTDNLCNIGGVLYDMGRFDEAEEYLLKAVNLGAHKAECLNNLGLLTKHREPTLALEHFQKAIDDKPDMEDAYWNKALVHLMLGEYIEGWNLFEHRYASGAIYHHGIDTPHWNGEDLTGKTILIHSEQGYGDSVQFCRYLPLLKTQFNAAEVIFLCQPPLVKLIQQSLPTVDVRPLVSNTIGFQFQFHAPLMSLPRGFKTLVETIPNQLPYLTVNPETSTKFAEKLSSVTKLKCGLVWAGGNRPGFAKASLVDKRRSMKLEYLKPILKNNPDVYFVSLQKDESANQLTPDYPVESTLITECSDFADTAALINNLDLVITIDSSVSHVTAALGKPTLILSRYDQCWRWLWKRTDSPWYPNAVTLFQQTNSGDWTQPVNQVSDFLSKFQR